jgi:hypothetical protein
MQGWNKNFRIGGGNTKKKLDKLENKVMGGGGGHKDNT